MSASLTITPALKIDDSMCDRTRYNFFAFTKFASSQFAIDSCKEVGTYADSSQLDLATLPAMQMGLTPRVRVS